MGHDDDGVLRLELINEVFNCEGGDGVQSRARLIHQNDLGRHGNRTSNTQTLLLTTGETRTWKVQTVLNLFPEVGTLERLLNQVLSI